METRRVIIRARHRTRTILPDRARNEVNFMVNKAIRRIGESHHYDITATRTPTSAAATVDKLSAIPQGDTDITRSADRCDPRHLRISFSLDGDTSFANDTEYVRLLVVKCKRDDATDAPTVAKVLETSSVWSMYNWDDRKDFVVLYDKLIKLAKSALREDFSRKGMISIKANKLGKLQYDNTATTGQNQLYLIALTTETTNGPTLRYYSRIIFKDL